MVLATIAILITGGFQSGLSCPVMGGTATFSSPTTDYNGVRIGYCCGGCKETFEKTPKKLFDQTVKAGKTVGVSLFDPVSRTPINFAEHRDFSSTFGGVRFYFASPENKDAFDKAPKAFGALPAKEVLFCPVNKVAIASYAAAGAYADYQKVRYYFCCTNCQAKFNADPAAFAKGVADKVGVPGVANPKPK